MILILDPPYLPPRPPRAKANESSVEQTHSLRANATLNLDPTRTTGLRRRYAAEMSRRFRRLKRDVRTSVDTNDCFALRPAPTLLAPLSPRQFEFKSSSEKVEGFMDWLEDLVDNDILAVSFRDGRQVVAHSGWQNLYIDSAYKAGLKRSNDELIRAGYDPSTLAGFPEFAIDAAFNRPIHADRVGLIYTRVFNELKGITDSMDSAISETLAQGIADGRNPRQLARMLVNRIEKVGDLSIVDSRGRFIPALQRARILARTEVISAHHQAMVNTYEEAGVAGVRVLAEFSTANDDRVCPSCQELEGQIFTLDEIRSMIPLHPQCRCVALPADIGEKVPKGRTFSDRAKRDIARAAGVTEKEAISKGVVAPVRGDFPSAAELATLKTVRSLGGSTGAELVEDARGAKWVRKRGASADHIREEVLADTLYRKANVSGASNINVPRVQLYETDEGPVKLAEFIDGRNLGSLSGVEKARAVRQAGDGFGLDAILGNWDVVGLDADNLLVDRAGKVWRIDNGGSLRFRAQGGLKEAADWGDHPVEFWTMRQNQGFSTFGTFKTVNIRTATKAVDSLGDDFFDDVAMDASLRETLKARLGHAKVMRNKVLDMRANTWDDSYIDNLTRHMMGLRKAGILDELPKSLRVDDVADVFDENGIRWDGLRGLKAASERGRPGIVDALGDGSNALMKLYNASVDAAKNINYHIAQGDASFNTDKIMKFNEALAGVKIKKSKWNPEAQKMANWLEGISKGIKAGIDDGKAVDFIDSVDDWFAANISRPSPSKAAEKIGVVARWERYMKDQGVSSTDMKAPARWQKSHAGGSTHDQAQGYMHFLKQQRSGAVDEAVMANGRVAEQAFQDYFSSPGQQEALTAWHALVQEVLGNVDFVGNDKSRRAMRLIRMEVDEAIIGGQRVGTGKRTLQRQWNNSGSAFVPVQLSGKNATIQAVSHDMITGSYMLERNSGQGDGAFYGDSENEFTFIGDAKTVARTDISKGALRFSGAGDTNAKKWKLPLLHIPGRLRVR